MLLLFFLIYKLHEKNKTNNALVRHDNYFSWVINYPRYDNNTQ